MRQSANTTRGMVKMLYVWNILAKFAAANHLFPTMTITYIFHSGFAVETDSSILVFDFWMDPTGAIDRILSSPKPLYVFSSHFHEDHFNREIFSWRHRRQAGKCTYIMSKDILRHRRAAKDEADAWLGKGASWHDDLLNVTATGSTDSGVSWVVSTEGKLIFHAGDLNNWYARFLADGDSGPIMSDEFGLVDPVKEEKRFLGELKDIRKVTDRFDVAMFPVDGRIGNGYTRGPRQFIERFKVGLLVPMHFTVSGFESAARMKEFTDAAGIGFWAIGSEGETIDA